MKNIIETKKLCKTFSNGGIQQHVLRNIDLEVYEGDFTIIMGASGAGAPFSGASAKSRSGEYRPSRSMDILNGLSAWNAILFSEIRRNVMPAETGRMRTLSSGSVQSTVTVTGFVSVNAPNQYGPSKDILPSGCFDPNRTVSERSGTSVPSTCTLYDSSFSAAAAHIARHKPVVSIWSLVIFFSFFKKIHESTSGVMSADAFFHVSR